MYQYAILMYHIITSIVKILLGQNCKSDFINSVFVWIHIHEDMHQGYYMDYATIHDCRHSLAVLEYIHSDQREPVVMYQAGIMRIKN